MKDTVLLATFVNHRRKVSSVLKLIAKNFEVINDQVFLLKDVNSENSHILSYNIVKKDIVFSDIIRNTISLHRKKETDTLYTLNALNELVILQNGDLDNSFIVNWDGYEKSILLTSVIDDADRPGSDEDRVKYGKIELKQIKTELAKVYKLRYDQ